MNCAVSATSIVSHNNHDNQECRECARAAIYEKEKICLDGLKTTSSDGTLLSNTHPRKICLENKFDFIPELAESVFNCYDIINLFITAL